MCRVCASEWVLCICVYVSVCVHKYDRDMVLLTSGRCNVRNLVGLNYVIELCNCGDVEGYAYMYMFSKREFICTSILIFMC